MSSDDEDFVFYGTPIEREEEITTRKKKAVAEASGQLRTAAPPWKQEVKTMIIDENFLSCLARFFSGPNGVAVTDEEGRRRFHGAFTGGYSAGYYNTVGSKEGWTPQSFTSSRKNRADVKQQNILNFLDDDEKTELEGRTLGTSTQYDTFGFTAVERARKEAQKEQEQRPAIIPGAVPDELIVPTTESIGVKLLKRMGWRQGRSIKDSNRSVLYDARREARKAFLSLSKNASSKVPCPNSDEEDTTRGKDLETEDDKTFSRSTPAYLLNPKQDLYGLGYDPFKQAPEFREKKRLRMSGDREMEHYKSKSIKGKIGPGFGIGALEDLDVEDEDVYASGYDFQDTYVQEIEEPTIENTNILRIMDKKRRDNLPGFKAASIPDRQTARFDPPVIPKDFLPHHKCPPLGNGCNNTETPPPEVPAPEDNNLKVLIEGVATIVARSGKLFEDLCREKNQSNPLFAFLIGGTGSDFYAQKLWEQRQKRGEQSRLWEEKGQKSRISEQMTAERRGKLLGEKALETSSKDSGYPVALAGSVNVQFQLSDTFTASANDQYDTKDRFYDDPAKQKRFEQFLKEKYEGGLRTKDSGGASYMSEAARARERLEFEAAADTMQKENLGKGSMHTNQLLGQLHAPTALQFTTGVMEKDKAQQEEVISMVPKREEFQWRPAPILCKRFDLIDPYMGKPPPAPRPRSKIDSLIFMPNTEESAANKQTSSISQVQNGKQAGETSQEEVESEVQVENVERPVDLYKAIFSDDSDDEEEATANIQVDDTQKKTEAANIALSRLEAGDFLESLGKELGLEVPHAIPFATPISEDKAGTRVTRHETINMASKDSTPVEKVRSASQNVRSSETGETGSKLDKVQNTNTVVDGHKIADGVSVGEFRTESNAKVLYATSAGQKQKQSRSSSSSQDEKSRKRSRSRRHKSRKSSSSDSESDDYRDRHGSSSRRREKEKSREKHSSRRHSKHSKHRKEREHHERRKDN